MKKDKYFTKGTITLISLLIFFIIIIIVFACLQSSSEVSEWWTRNIMLPYLGAIGNFTSIIPFSLTEVFFMILVTVTIFILILLIISLFKRRFKKSLKYLTLIATIITTVISCYSFLTTLAYSRDKLNFIPQYENNVSSSSFKDIAIHYTEEFNDSASKLSFDDNHDVVMPYSISELGDVLINEYSKIDSNYLGNYTPKIKEMMTSWLYLEFQITGVTFTVFDEANINKYNTKMDLPFTAAHELAHAKGIMREADANLIALYICLTSDDPYLNFSGYMRSYSSIFALLGYTKDKTDSKNVYDILSSDIKNAYSFNSAYWKDHNLLGDIANFFNDLYLKLSGGGGTSDYEDNFDASDSGEKDENGDIIYQFNFSPFQKLLFDFYY
jgi:ABC-type nickel/cobalt efflux system permease component RcnA